VSYKLLITEIDLNSRIDGGTVARRANNMLKMVEMQEKQAFMNKRFTEKRDLSLNVVAYGTGKASYQSTDIQ
jgi:hypothetical protein